MRTPIKIFICGFDVHRAVRRNITSIDVPMSQIYFIWVNAVPVSDGLSVHHQEFKTVGIVTVTAVCLLGHR